MVDALCPYFGKCGGCTAQQIAYEDQLAQKKQLLIKMIGHEHVEVFSGEPYGYRNRMDFVFCPSGLGLREKGNWKYSVPINNCPIADEPINRLLREINSFFAAADVFDVRKHSGAFRYAVIRTGDSSAISFVLNANSSKLANAIDQIKAFSQHTSAENVVVTYVPSQTDVSVSSDYFVVKGKDVLRTTYLGRTFEYSVQGFFQNNHAMAEKMQEYVHGLLEKCATSQAHLLDLYGGVGTFGIMNAGLFKKATIVESVKECIDAAQKNMQNNAVRNAEALVMDAKQIHKLSLGKPLYVITDPPRSGMDEKTIHTLNALDPECIIYISCNVQQLAKELPKLKNYSIKSAALFDLFPQTPHSEAIVELIKKSSE